MTVEVVDAVLWVSIFKLEAAIPILNVEIPFKFFPSPRRLRDRKVTRGYEELQEEEEEEEEEGSWSDWKAPDVPNNLLAPATSS